MNKIIKVFMLIVLTTTIVASITIPVMGFKISVLGLGESIHENITVQGLDFLDEAVSQDIAGYNRLVDIGDLPPGTSDDFHHFDSCNFTGSINHINNLYWQTIFALDPANTNLAAAKQHFGALLHTVQDFYAHSNWVELGKTDLNPPALFDNELGFWRSITPYNSIIDNDVIVIEGPVITTAYTVTRPGPPSLYPASAVVTVTRLSDSEQFLGLITGDYGGTLCPESIKMDHGNPLTDGHEGDLNKDRLGLVGRDAMHLRARELAILQTRHEWFRLLSLVREYYGSTAADVLCREWVKPGFESDAGCLDPLFFTESSLLPNGYINIDYAAELTADGGTSPYSNWIITDTGLLPAGLSLDPVTGMIAGTPIVTGTAIFTIQFTDSDGRTETKDFELTVNDTPSKGLAFSSNRPPTNRFQVWQIETDPLGSPTAVTNAGTGTQESRGADWSDAIGKLVYQFGAPGVRGIHMINPDGTSDVRLTCSLSDEVDPSWSPDGQFIVYSFLLGSDYEIWIHKVGSQPQCDASGYDGDDYSLLSRPGNTDSRPVWSPDGTRIAFVSSLGSVGTDPEIFVVAVAPDSNGYPRAVGSVIPLTDNSFSDFNPTWSPDSSYIAFQTTRTGGNDIYRMSATMGESDADNFKQLTTNGSADRNPAWSYDGQTIAFVSERDSNREIYLMSADEGESDLTNLVRVTNDPATDDDPTWAPQAGSLVFDQPPPAIATLAKALASQLVIAVQDSSGITNTFDNSTIVTLEVGTLDSGVLTCNDGLSKVVVNGLATFSGCQFDHAGIYTIRASAPSLISADSNPIDVRPGLLLFIQQPSESAIVGTPLVSQPVVAVQDANRATDSNDNSTVVTLEVAGGPSSALTCSGGLSRVVTNGLATFSDCQFDQAETYTIQASAPSLSATISNYIGVSLPILTTEQADLAVNLIPSPAPVIIGQNRTYTVTVSNNGPATATGVTLVDLQSYNETFVSVTPNQGSCLSSYYRLDCDLGDLISGGEVVIVMTIIPSSSGPISNIVSVSGVESDPDLTNNTAVVTIQTSSFPAPVLTNLDPALVVAGSEGLLLKVNGINFVAGSTVYWNYTPRVTTVISATQVSAEINASDLSLTGDLATAIVTVVNPGGGASNMLPFTIVSGNVQAVQSVIVEPDETATAATLPMMAGNAGVVATLTNNTDGSDSATLTTARYSINPTPGTIFDVSGGFVDLLITGADASDVAAASFYYPSTVTGTIETNLQLLYWTGVAWEPVRSSGVTTPTKNTADNLDNTLSGGRFSVMFDDTSDPLITNLTGTIFAATVDNGDVDNVAPIVGEVVSTNEPTLVNTLITTTAIFTDPDVFDTHTAIWDWGDNITSTGTITEALGSGKVSGAHSYSTPGIYSVQVMVVDDQGNSGEAIFYIIIYDPNNSYVTGMGSIDSPVGAYTADPTLAGPAGFAMYTYYDNSSSFPLGRTKFSFPAANINFFSKNFNWLVVYGGNATFYGQGTINHRGNYGFMVTIFDGQDTGVEDRYRIRIWDIANGNTVIYDNGYIVDNTPTQPISSGRILVR